ncbi:hypothetical protein L195_g046535, partial [Trifolium pratense]
SILQEFAFGASIVPYRSHWTSSPLPVTSISKLNVDSSPCSPIRQVVSRCSLKPLVCEFVSEVITYVPQVLSIKIE